MFHRLKNKFLKRFSRTSEESEKASEGPSDGRLTPADIELLQLSWHHLRGDISRFKMSGAELFIKFFTQYPDFQRQFESFKDMPLYTVAPSTAKRSSANPMRRVNKKLMAHGTYVMYTIGMLIDHFDEPEVLSQMLKRVARNHYRRRVSITAFELLRDTFLQHLVEQLGAQMCDARCLLAWRKAFSYILELLDDEFSQLDSDVAKQGSYFQLNKVHQEARREAQLRQVREIRQRHHEASLPRNSSMAPCKNKKKKTGCLGRFFGGKFWTSREAISSSCT